MVSRRAGTIGEVGGEVVGLENEALNGPLDHPLGGIALIGDTGRCRCWSNVHIDDLVELFVLALERVRAGSFYEAENGEASMRESVLAIRRLLKLGDRTSRSSSGRDQAVGGVAAAFTFGFQQPGSRQTRSGPSSAGSRTAARCAMSRVRLP